MFAVKESLAVFNSNGMYLYFMTIVIHIDTKNKYGICNKYHYFKITGHINKNIILNMKKISDILLDSKINDCVFSHKIYHIYLFISNAVIIKTK